MNIYSQTLDAGIKHAVDRAARIHRHVFVYGDGVKIYVRTAEEGEPDGATCYGEASPTGDFYKVEDNKKGDLK